MRKEGHRKKRVVSSASLFVMLLPGVMFALVCAVHAIEGSWMQTGADIGGESLDDQSGHWPHSVSMSNDGTRVAIGATLNDGTADSAGHVRVHEWSSANSSWSQLGNDIDGEASGDWSGWSVSMSGDGARVAVGARNNHGAAGSNSGHVRVYEWSSTSGWAQVGGDIDGEASGDWSGWSVSMSANGSRIAIGARDNDGAADDAGHVRIHEWSSDTSSWVQLGSDIDGEAVNDESGTSVSLSADGSRVAIGAPGHRVGILNGVSNSQGYKVGQVRVYAWDPGTGSWTQLGSDIYGEGHGDDSGASVSMSADGSRVAIGAPGNSGAGMARSGHVRVYEWLPSGSWSQLGSDIDGETFDDASGSTVSMSDDGSRVAIGARYNDLAASGGGNAGHVRVFEWSAGASSWVQIGSDIDGDDGGDASGASVSMSANGLHVAIGAPGCDVTARNAGCVRVFELIGSPLPPMVPPPSSTTPPEPAIVQIEAGGTVRIEVGGSLIVGERAD